MTAEDDYGHEESLDACDDRYYEVAGDLSLLLLATPHRHMDVTEPERCAEAVHWWMELTAEGGEGMVVKPLEFVVRGKRGLGQPELPARAGRWPCIPQSTPFSCERTGDHA